MKQFLKKRWHGIPVGIVSGLLALVLVAGGAFAAFSFLTLTTEITVDEPLTIEYNLWNDYGGDDLWHPLPDEDSMTLERMAGSTFAMQLKVTSEADNPLTVNTVFSGDTSNFIFGGFPNYSTCLGETVTLFDVTVDVKGDAPPGVYTVTFNFTRE